MRRAIGVVLVGLGVFSIVLAVLFPTVVVPRTKKIPLNTNVTVIATGPGKVLDASTGQLKDVTLRATQIVRSDTSASDSTNTTQNESLCIVIVQGVTPNCVAAPDPRLLSVTTDRVTFSRTTAEAVHVDGWNEAVNGDTTVRHTGLAYEWPIDSKKKTYQFYQPDVKAAFPAAFVRSEKINGLNTYVYVSDTGTQPYKIQGLLDGTYTDKRTVWVEPKTGVILKGQETQVQTLANGQVALSTTLTFDDASIASLTKTAKDAIKTLTLASVWAPIVLATIGLASLIGGWLLLRARGQGPSDGGGRRGADQVPPYRTSGDGQVPDTPEQAAVGAHSEPPQT